MMDERDRPGVSRALLGWLALAWVIPLACALALAMGGR
jgi:hypothetical protein